MDEKLSRKWAAFVAGDEKIFFPALVSLVSLEEYNPGRFDRYMVFDGDRRTAEMTRLLELYGIIFLDIKDVKYADLIQNLPALEEGRWPAEIYVNWTLPEHMHDLGYEYSIRLDYDTLSIGPFPTQYFENNTFSVAALPVDGPVELPETVVDRTKRELGIDPTHTQAYIAGVVLFNSSKIHAFDFVKRYFAFLEIMLQECPDHPGTLEQVTYDSLVVNMEDAKNLPPRLHTRARVTRNLVPGFTTTSVMLHLYGHYKPWRPMPAKDLVKYTKWRMPMIPFYRMVWLDYASRVEGFNEFCQERPYSPLEIMSMANTILNTERKIMADLSKP